MAVETLQVGGLKPLDPSWELYWVRAGGATVVPLRGDDRHHGARPRRRASRPS